MWFMAGSPVHLKVARVIFRGKRRARSGSWLNGIYCFDPAGFFETVSWAGWLLLRESWPSVRCDSGRPLTPMVWASPFCQSFCGRLERGGARKEHDIIYFKTGCLRHGIKNWVSVPFRYNSEKRVFLLDISTVRCVCDVQHFVFKNCFWNVLKI